MTTVTSTPDGLPTGRRARTAARVADAQRVRRPFEEVGALIAFGARGVRAVPKALRLYPGEVVRQCALLVRSNALVIIFMFFMLGAMLGVTVTFLFESVGLESYVSATTGGPAMRGAVEVVFGWVFAAKYGCGIVAELGAMRISEEIDAMDVMGVRSLPYLVGCRLVASFVVLPSLFVIALATYFLSSRIFFVDIMNAVSPGGFEYILFLVQRPQDFIIVLSWTTLIGVVVTLVSCYYGYNATGGPVGVGRSTAQAMLVNLVVISVISMVLAQVFYANVFTDALGN